MADMQDERHEGVGLEDYLRVLRERAWIIVLCVLIVFLASLVPSIRTTPLYNSSAELIYDKTNINSAVVGLDLYSYDYDRDRTIAAAIAVIGRNEAISESVQAQLKKDGLAGADLSPAELSGMVRASGVTDSDRANITVTSTDPDEAAAVANAFADQFVIYNRDVRRSLVSEARGLIQDELTGMTPSELATSYGLMMQDKYESLRILEAMQNSDFKVLGRAAAPSAPFTPQTKRDVALALVLGLALGVGLVFLIEYLDKRIKDERTLETVSGLPVLASVPVVGRRWNATKHHDRSVEIVGFAGDRSPTLESFRALRSTLQYFNIDGGLRKILVTSGVPLEGKTVTAVNLGISLAMSGRRVIILEADLRRPMVHKYLNLQNETGLSNLLAGTVSVHNAMQLVPMDPLIPARSRKGENSNPAIVTRKNLYCITSGALPPNPTELLQSSRMAEIIAELDQLADYVLIDTPPVLAVSDAVALSPLVDAVILTARLHSTTRGELEQTREILQRVGAHVIGVVAGGVKSGRGSYYRRGYQYRYGRYGGYGY
jgi:succinoglycan biosynthesis transport protein ExoP